MALLRMNRLVVRTTVVRFQAVSMSRNPKTLANSEVRATAASPHLRVAIPVSAPCAMAETSPTMVRMNPTVLGPYP